MRWTLELVDPNDDRFKKCGEYRSEKSKKVMCEYHPDSHPIDHHYGRGRTGRWYSWPVEPTWVTAPGWSTVRRF